MTGVKQAFGYTIVEVMIVLAVSGVMFVIALNFINGKQEKVSFQQGSNELASRIQGIIAEVTDGQYTDIPVTCTSGVSSLNISGTTVPAGPASHALDQGANIGCTFLGKMLHFRGGESSDYEVFSLAGTRLIQSGVNAGLPVTEIADTQLTPIDSTLPSGNVTGINLTRQYTTPQSLNIKQIKMLSTDGLATWDNSYAFGFMQGLGTGDVDAVTGASNGTYKSGAQTLNIIAARNVAVNQNQATAAGNINVSNPNAIKTVKLVCLAVTDGTRWALVNVGSNGTDSSSQLSVEVKQKGLVKGGVPVECP